MSTAKVDSSKQGSYPTSERLPFGANGSLFMLSRLLLSENCARDEAILRMTRAEFVDMAALASSNHVIIRALNRFRAIVDESGDAGRVAWAEDALQQEQARIDNAVSFLQKICSALEDANCRAVVIKSLDHWPDLGSDLDLYTDALPANVIGLMRQRFHAELAHRSWGDRMANKWNFLIPGLPESVEIHMRRLGQTGEQVSVANSVIRRARSIHVGNHLFRVPSPEVRLMICTLQRMYRHFYARLCDIADTAALLETNAVDFDLLRSSAQEAGIWEGVATLLAIVSDYVTCYRGYGVNLPSSVTSAARFGGDQIWFGRDFLRIPIMPHSAKLYASQLTSLMTKGELKNAARLSVLPCLAAAAALQFKVTGSDKGIW
ncbi:MAG TPA: nucleotidyltransferase family protein [Terriglobales bacterium]|nr:nucleotidyltransferase family protein [Terriglobales bacterium]